MTSARIASVASRPRFATTLAPEHKFARLVLALIGVVLVAGCATHRDVSEPGMDDQHDRLKTCVVEGALAGALFGYALGGTPRASGRGAAAGAGLKMLGCQERRVRERGYYSVRSSGVEAAARRAEARVQADMQRRAECEAENDVYRSYGYRTRRCR